ncbi:DMT family transporter [Aneurinibacillus aneurinilyticus]|uniref:EamA family transporter n=1 Tax=Aneurinibacillus aneurinilyticus TaxID=1391 RepID=A0A848CPZ4_ANEAE|nr:EamA family transporter [Aneurinibacillus aneurinilyticus]NME97785.1 EamA family transporter [Aneurinibacillus aneurinilyticus]
MDMKNNSSKPWKGMYWLMLAVPLFWGGSFSTAEHVVSEIPPLVAATLRFALAGLLLTMVAILKSEWTMPVLKQGWKGLLFVSLTGIFGYNALFFLGLKYTSAINGALIIATMPVFVTVGAVLFLKEAWSRTTALSLVLSLVGVVIVITKGSFNTISSLSFNVGDVLFLAALACGVAYGLLGKVIMKKISPLFATTLMTLIGSVFLGVSSLIEGGWEKVPYLSSQGWLEMLYMVLCGTLIGYVIFNKGVEQIGASRASIYLNLTPIVTTLFSVVLYNTTMTWQQMLGMVMVLIGVCLATLGKVDGS